MPCVIKVRSHCNRRHVLNHTGFIVGPLQHGECLRMFCNQCSNGFAIRKRVSIKFNQLQRVALLLQ